MRLTSLLSRTIASCAVVGALSLAAPAGATTLTNTAWLVPPGGESYTIHWAGHTPVVNPAATGGFTGTFGGNPIVFWCFDLLHTFSLGTTYNDYTAIQLSGPMADTLSRLFNVAAANGGVGDLDHSAAFQLAIWNIEYDGDTSLSSGGFFVTGGAGAINIANSWLTLLSNPLYANPTNTITELDSGSRHQNFITASNTPSECCKFVPEPPVLPLVLTALGAAALVETRRRMRARGG